MRATTVKRFILGAVGLFTLGLLVTGCFEKYSYVINHVQDKAVMIEVPTVMEETILTFNGGGFEVHKETATHIILGSGVFISPVGHILTCAHLFNNGQVKTITVSVLNGTTYYATLLYQDTDRDLALIKVDGQHNPAYLADSVSLGQEVIAVGNPEGLEFTSTHGIVSHVNRDISENFLFTQTDAPINGGNSGGPLFNLRGQLVGINARKSRGADGLGFAISLKTINEFLELFRGLKQ